MQAGFKMQAWVCMQAGFRCRQGSYAMGEKNTWIETYGGMATATQVPCAVELC
jgi:hypothetical protein